MAGRSYFVADLHLCASRPRVTATFLDFLGALDGEALYILGDLFEAWVGDDDLDAAPYRDVADALRRVGERGIAVNFMHGNRDFLVAGRYAAACGMQLLADPTLADIHGTPTLLMHGDTLCTGDAAYLAFRGQVRDPAWQAAFLAQPLAVRRAQALAARTQSESAKAGKAAEIMDVDAREVARVLAAYGYPRLIHGHTHRPGRHEVMVDGHACERWVLPDWDARWGYVVCDAAGCELVIEPL